MSDLSFDLITRVENKPTDCGKRVSYSEINLGYNYYLLYNQELHKVVVNSITDSDCFVVMYLQEYSAYLGEAKANEYLIDIHKYNVKFYEII